MGRRRSKSANGYGVIGVAVIALAGIGKITDTKKQTEAESKETPSVTASAPIPSSAQPLEREQAISPPKQRIRSVEELLRIKRYVPQEVTLTSDTKVPVIVKGKEIGSAAVSQGLKTKVVGLAGERLLLEYDSRRQTVPISSTDFLERVVAEAEK
jgi:hypothetical protein